MREQIRERLESQMQSMQIQKDKAILSLQEHHSIDMHQIEKSKLERKYELRLH
jgi:hypothetical protein